MDLLLKNGTVVTPQGPVRADLGVRGEVISYIGRTDVDHLRREGRAVETLDCSGCLLLPGVIDAHVQLETSFGFGDLKDDFYSGSRAAACGGVTTLIDYARQGRGESPLEALRSRRKVADAKVGIDYTLHLTLIDLTPEVISEAPQVLQEGIRSFKVYMAYGKAGRRADDGAILALMRALSRCGGLLGIHAEVDEHINRATQDLLRSGRSLPQFHGEAHPPISEVAAVELAIRMCEETGCEIYIKHVSTAKAASLIGDARRRGLPVWGETCPQYLLLDEGRYAGEDAPLFILSPPLRSKDNQEGLWAALASGDLQVAATDHASYSRDQKLKRATTFEGVPPGLPGVETLLPLLYTYAVDEGRLSLLRLAQVLSEGPSRIFGLYPRKGVLQVGSEADVVVYDPAPSGIIDASRLAMNVDYSPFEGMCVKGRVRETIRRGRVVAREGRWVGEDQGRFVPVVRENGR